MKKSLPLAALLGATSLVGLLPDADAAPLAATLLSVKLYSNSGPSTWNGSLDTSTWTFDAVTGTAVQTGGTYSRQMKAGSSPLMRHTMTGVTLSSGAATGATWACIEGNFGPAIAAIEHMVTHSADRRSRGSCHLASLQNRAPKANKREPKRGHSTF